VTATTIYTFTPKSKIVSMKEMKGSAQLFYFNTHARRTQLIMNNGKRSINISLGTGSPNLSSRPNPFARPTRPLTTTALGFGDDEDEDNSDDRTGSTGSPKRKQIKLDHGQEDTEDQEEDAFSKLGTPKAPASASRPTAPPAKKSVFDEVDDEEKENAFSRLDSKKGTQC
jgi:hypothetical protein